MGVDPAKQANLRELAQVLDDELQRLPASCREALVVCHLEGLSLAHPRTKQRGNDLGLVEVPGCFVDAPHALAPHSNQPLDRHRVRASLKGNLHDGDEVDLFLVNVDGSGLEQITTSPEFDAFPMFSPDGRKLVWASNRNGQVQGETNIFIADWVEHP